jgi:hypothetical protein
MHTAINRMMSSNLPPRPAGAEAGVSAVPGLAKEVLATCAIWVLLFYA